MSSTRTAVRAAALMLLAADSAQASSAPRTAISGQTHRPEHLGQCFTTTYKSIQPRLAEERHGKLVPIPNTGSSASFADGHYVVSYDQLPGIDRARPGDPVRFCVTYLPSGCPKGDLRGIEYKGRDLRTHLTWKAADAEHGCGGA